MSALWAIVLLVVLMTVGVPVAWSFAGVLAYLVYLYDVNLNILMLQGFRSLNSVILIALPLFVLTGYLMQSGGIARRQIYFIEMLVRGRRGGMGASLVLASGVFGAISGTATAAVASIGTVMVGPLEQRGYPRGYSSALLGISSLLGILIPPSITMILFAVVTRQSVAACFAAAIGPAILLIIGLILVNRFCVGRFFDESHLGDSGSETQQPRSRLRITLSAAPALSMPVIILGGIYGGIFTPTEAAAVAAFVALAIGLFLYRDMTWRRLYDSVISATETTGSIILILLFSFMIGRIMAAEQAPQELSAVVAEVFANPTIILLAVNIVLIVAGALMDDVSVTVIMAPLFLPLMVNIGVEPVHFAAIVACSVVIGANSPPVAPILYMACRVGRVSVHKAMATALALIAVVALPVMLITTFVPEVSLFLPRQLGFL